MINFKEKIIWKLEGEKRKSGEVENKTKMNRQKIKMNIAKLSLVATVVFSGVLYTEAQIYSSPSFRVFQPITNESNTGGSASFQLISTVNQVSVMQTNPAGPTISSVQSYLSASDSAVITWRTNIMASSTLRWGSAPATFDNSVSSASLSTDHSLKITGLDSGTTYYYKITAYDAFGNASTSDNGGNGFTLTTSASNTVYVGIGGQILDNRDRTTPVISDITISKITDTSAVVSFRTSKITDEIVKTGNNFDMVFGTSTVFKTSHNVTLDDLSPGTQYPFRVYVVDNLGNSAESELMSFKTTGINTKPPTTSDKTPEPPKAEPVTPESSADINSFGDLIKKGTVAFLDRAIQVFFKSIQLNPSAMKVDESSFISSVSEAAERIITPPTISGIESGVTVGPREAVVTWVTDRMSNSLVAYSKDGEFDPKSANPYSLDVGFPDDDTVSHKVTIINLEPSTTYHYKIRSQAKIGPVAESEDRTFTTLSLTPEILDIKFKEITDGSALLLWETNLPTKTRATLEIPDTGESKVIKDESYLKVHELTISDLIPSTSYTLRIQAIDESENTSVSAVLPFSTAVSVSPPQVSQVKITTSLISDRVEAVQTIISWKTDKHSNSRVYYAEGNNTKLFQSTPTDTAYVKDHVVITTAFKPGAIYQIQAESEDPQGHIGESSIYTVMTPQPRRSAVDLILENMQTTFGIFRFGK